MATQIKKLPATGDNQQNSGLLFGSLVAGLGSLLLGRRRRKIIMKNKIHSYF